MKKSPVRRPAQQPPGQRPAVAAEFAPAFPSGGLSSSGLVPGEPPVLPPRRTAWSEGVHRLRDAAMTEPGRLRALGAVLAALVLLFGGLTVWQVMDRHDAADSVVGRTAPLKHAAEIYRLLAQADTTASSGYLAGGDEPGNERRFEGQITEVWKLLSVTARESPTSKGDIDELGGKLPEYTSLVDAANANNRQGFPVGGVYLRSAHQELMHDELLPRARHLYGAQRERLSDEYRGAKAWPSLALIAGVLAVAALGWAQRRDYLRTNRVLSPGLLGATVACVAVLAWLTVAHTLAREELKDSARKGARSLQTLNEARIDAFTARGDENVTLVVRDGSDTYEKDYGRAMARLAGGSAGRFTFRPADGLGGASPGDCDDPVEGEGWSGGGGTVVHRGGELGEALSLADDAGGRVPVRKAREEVGRWRRRHLAARALDERGDYRCAVGKVIRSHSTDESFSRVDGQLARAAKHEEGQLTRHARAGGGALSTSVLAVAAVLTLLGAAAAVYGVGRRLSEYR